MPIKISDIKFYGSATMPDDDSVTEIGGAISTSKKVEFNDISPSGNIQVVSSDAGDTTQTVTVHGRDGAGVAISEGKTLNGLTPVAMTAQTTWERLRKAIKSASTTGDVAVEEATAERSNTAQGGDADTITLDTGASGTDDFYTGMVIRLTSGTGANQIRQIIKYVGSTKVATVSRAWGTNPDGTTGFRIAQGMVFDKAPSEIMEVRKAFYDAVAPASGSRDYYEKVFAKNTHATLALTSAVIKEAADPSGKITFGVAATLDDTGTNGAGNNRQIAPGGITFDNADKNVANSQNHSAGSGQGIWVKLSLVSTDAPTKTTYTLREEGTTT